MLALDPDPATAPDPAPDPDPAPANPAARAPGAGEEADDSDLLRRIASGDRLAFARLARRHTPRALRLADRFLGRGAEAEEVVQEALLRVWTHAADWDPDRRARFTTWLHRVVANLCLDRLRRPTTAALETAPDLPDPAPGAPTLVADRQRAALVRAAMADLPERQRAAITLFYFEDMTATTVAQTLDMTVAALESLLARARRSLRERLAARGVTGPEEAL